MLIAALTQRKLRQRDNARLLALDGPRAIVEEGFVTLGGIEQWISIRGEDRDNPILVVVHGGPGSPYSIFAPALRAWERHFTVVQWDQRGAGKTLGRNHGARGNGALTFDRLADDGLALVEHVCARLGQAQVLLLGSSAGSVTGVLMAERRPERFAVYIGTDQQVDVARAETLAHRLTLDRLRAAGRHRDVAALTALGDDPTRWDPPTWQRNQRWVCKCDPLAAAMGGKLIVQLLASPSHSLRDIVDFVVGLRYSQACLFYQLMAFRAPTRLSVPVVVVHGERDIFTPASLVKEWINALEAPHKSLTLLPDAGHLGGFFAPERFLAALLAKLPDQPSVLVRACSRPSASPSARRTSSTRSLSSLPPERSRT